MKKMIVIAGTILAANKAMSASYDTLPKGVNMFVARQVQTSKIESKFDENNRSDSLSLSEHFTSSRLADISDAFKSYFEELKKISPDAYNQFSLGEFKASAWAQVNAQGFALAHGLTDHFTVYGMLPVYHIKTSVAFQQNQKSNMASIGATVANAPTNSAISTFIRQLTQQLPETNEQLMQSLIVNYYGYKPLGTWQKDALGDAEIGGIYRLTDFADKGLALAVGAVLPTGDADDPDSLQDVSTGDGQYDAFIEGMSGISFFDSVLQFDLKTRFTYQMATNKEMRASTDANVPLSKSKTKVNEKLGNKIDSTFTVTLNPTSWLNFNSSYMYSATGRSIYGTTDPQVKKALEENSESVGQWAKVGVGFSSVELYKAKKVDIPFEVNVSAQRLLNAKNTANYERYDLELRLYF